MSEDKRSALDILLSGPAHNVAREPETEQVEIPRLTELYGEPFYLTIRALTYDQIVELRGSETLDLDIVLAGTVDPDFRSRAFAEKFGVLKPGEEWGDHGIMPRDGVPALLIGGEITEISREIQKLSGYFRATTKVVKKN